MTGPVPEVFIDTGPPVEVLSPPDVEGADDAATASGRELWTGCPYCLSPKHAGRCQDIS